MARVISAFILFIVLVTVDQYVKYIFVSGWEYQGEVFSLVLTYNYGVAFSMFAFLAENLKYIQIGLLFCGILYLLFNKEVFNYYYVPISMLFAGGVSNIIDRFVHGGVVDYIFWHYWFEFAIFNLADVIIDLAVVIILIMQFTSSRKEKAQLPN